MKKDEDTEKSATLILGDEHARLVIENGADKGKEFMLRKPAVTVGRHPENDVCLPQDRTVSRFHGRVFVDEKGTYFFEDLNSTNGTTIGEHWLRRSDSTQRSWASKTGYWDSARGSRSRLLIGLGDEDGGGRRGEAH